MVRKIFVTGIWSGGLDKKFKFVIIIISNNYNKELF